VRTVGCEEVGDRFLEADDWGCEFEVVEEEEGEGVAFGRQ